MFTGIITHLGKVEKIEINNKKDALFVISCQKKNLKRKLEIGCSIAINGICLTLISKKILKENYLFSFQASNETCEKTTLEKLKIGEIVNLEFALRVGDELGGHMVLGHVDEVAKIVEIKKIKQSTKFTFSSSKKIMRFIAPKASVVLNGVSLTINEVSGANFSVNIIPHTLENTGFKQLKVGNLVNLEIDAIARYLDRLI
jgi:riboflavin synthase